MKMILATILVLFSVSSLNAQEIYSQAYGNPKDKPILFLHGGPGYNSVMFELTTAQELANNGFYVIVYDRRGEGRSVDTSAKFTFEQTCNDILNLYNKYNLEEAVLIGHSFGGIAATIFAENYPDKVKSIVLVAAPVSLQETFKTIIATSKAIYESKNDSINLNYIAMLEKMDTSTIQYSSYCFMHAMQNGFYTPKHMSENAKNIYAQFKSDTLMMKYSTQMTYQAPQGFWNNENYTTINLKTNLQKLKQSGIEIYALYGKDDGLYSANQVNDLKSIVGDGNLKYFENCSHNVFIDQQAQFIEALKNWLK